MEMDLMKIGLEAILEELERRGEIIRVLKEEPPVGSRVSDNQGDVWMRKEAGWGIGDTSDFRCTWANLLPYAPLVRVQ